MKVLLNTSVALMTLTGIIFAAMKYWMKSSDPFAVANHPWQPHMLTAHVLIAPFAVFAFGWTFSNHIWPALVNRAPNRASGVVSMLLIAPMVATGYLMQVSTADATRHAFAMAHWISAGLYVVVYVAHLTGRRPSS